MKYLFTILLYIGFTATGFSQLESSNTIHLNGAPSSRYVTGIDTIYSSESALPAKQLLNLSYITSIATGVNLLDAQFPLISNLVDGLIIQIITQSSNTGPASLSVNNSPYFPLLKDGFTQLDSGNLIPNKALQIIFSNNSFQILSEINRPCPINYVDVNDKYCISEFPLNVSTFYDAIETCGNQGAMLCTWQQWYLACIDSSNNGSQGYLTNFEWVNDAANNGSDAKVAGYFDNISVNGYGCKKSYSLPPNNTFLAAPAVTNGDTIYIRFRCCYQK